jgi:hypothetical protein
MLVAVASVFTQMRIMTLMCYEPCWLPTGCSGNGLHHVTVTATETITVFNFRPPAHGRVGLRAQCYPSPPWSPMVPFLCHAVLL